MRAQYRAQTVPLLSLFAAFSFVLMMFNLPLPGGTTGHAVGVGIAAVVLGPSMAAISISMALLVQALFFGDGGVTAYGANCFNMAIVAPYTAAAVYQLCSWSSKGNENRRAWAAGIAGYVAINAAALCAAIEFGIQPMLFHDASGAPLYAPYPLTVAVPAMMIGHLTVAGIAEFIVSAGLMRYVQRSRPELVRESFNRYKLKGLWATLAAALLLTPLGIFAVGTAWGEWKAEDFSNKDARQEIVAASGGRALPASAPAGLGRLSGFWKAPVAEYAPVFITSRSLGYTFSAIVGVVLLVIAIWVLSPLWQRRRQSFTERTSRAMIEALDRALFSENTAQSSGFLQRTDARVKVLGAVALIVAAAAAANIYSLVVLISLAVLTAALSRVPVFPTLLRIWASVFLLASFVLLPSLLFTPVRSAALILLRAETISTICAILCFTAAPSSLLRALHSLKVPASVVGLAGITYRYIFLFLESARSLLEAREVRMLGRTSSPEARRLATLSISVLLEKVFVLSGEVQAAMIARGFRGEFYTLRQDALRQAEWLQIGFVVLLAAMLVWFGR